MSGPTNELDCHVRVRMVSSTTRTQMHLVCDGEQCVPMVPSAERKIEGVERDVPPCFTRRNELYVSHPRIALKSPIRESYPWLQYPPPHIHAHDSLKYTASPRGRQPADVQPPHKRHESQTPIRRDIRHEQYEEYEDAQVRPREMPLQREEHEQVKDPGGGGDLADQHG